MDVGLKIWRFNRETGDRELREYEIDAPEEAASDSTRGQTCPVGPPSMPPGPASANTMSPTTPAIRHQGESDRRKG